MPESNGLPDVPCRTNGFPPWHCSPCLVTPSEKQRQCRGFPADSCARQVCAGKFKPDRKGILPPPFTPEDKRNKWNALPAENAVNAETPLTVRGERVGNAFRIGAALLVSSFAERDLFQARWEKQQLGGLKARPGGFPNERRPVRTPASLNPTRSTVCPSEVPWRVSQPFQRLDPRCPGRICTCVWPTLLDLLTVP